MAGYKVKGKNGVGRQILPYLLLCIAAVSLFSYFQLSPTFADPDSFYHAKMALLLRDRGAITELPWLTATTLRYSFADHHFLYHLLLIPFVTIFSPLVGLKVATVLFAAGAILAFYGLLRTLKVTGPMWYTIFLLTVGPFLFRFNLAKAQGLVLLLLLLALIFLFSRRPLPLLFASFLYVWLYAGWPILVVITILYVLLNHFRRHTVTDVPLLEPRRKRLDRQNMSLLFVVLFGCGLGVFFSPYFPKNLWFYWQQTLQIGLVNYQHLIDVGAEWYPYQPWNLLTSALPFFALLLVGGVAFFHRFKRQPVQSWVLLALTLMFLGLTFKSRRNVEYLVPFGILFSALAITVWLRVKRPAWLTAQTLRYLAIGTLIGASPLLYLAAGQISRQYADGFAYDRFAGAAGWLAEHAEPEAIVFQSDWDEFPLLFYHNDSQYYIVGLDPTFMYNADPDLYRRWVAITTGKERIGLGETIGTLFDADYVFIDLNGHDAMDRNIAADRQFQAVYQDEEAKVYQLTK